MRRVARVSVGILTPLLLAGLVLGASLASISIGSASSHEQYRVYGLNGDRTFPVTVGSLIAQGSREETPGTGEEYLCKFPPNTGVLVEVLEGDIGPVVQTTVDEDCRLLVKDIIPPGQPVPLPSTEGGVEPVPSPGGGH